MLHFFNVYLYLNKGEEKGSLGTIQEIGEKGYKFNICCYVKEAYEIPVVLLGRKQNYCCKYQILESIQVFCSLNLT